MDLETENIETIFTPCSTKQLKIKMEATQTKFTEAELTAMNVKDLNKAGTALGIKNAKNFPKPTLLKMCISKVKRAAETTPVKEEVLPAMPEGEVKVVVGKPVKKKTDTKANSKQPGVAFQGSDEEEVAEPTELKSAVKVNSTTEENSKIAILEEGKSKKSSIDPRTLTFASTCEKDGKEYYQYYPYKKKHEGKTLSVFRKVQETGKTVTWAEDSEGTVIIPEGKSWDVVYLEAIKLRKEKFTDHKVVVYFDYSIFVPSSYGKTY